MLQKLFLRSSWRLLETLPNSSAAAVVSLIDCKVTKFLLFSTSCCWTSFEVFTVFMIVLGIKKRIKLFIFVQFTCWGMAPLASVWNVTRNPFRMIAISLNKFSCTLINGLLRCSTKLSNDLLSLGPELWIFCNMNLIWIPLSATTSFSRESMRE